jgi:sulfide dehydrogenase cytochrome subunit
MHRRTVAAALLVTIGAVACSADDQEALRRYGRHLAQECSSCHRSDAMDGAIPSLAGRPQAEIVTLLQDFRDGRKTNPVMISVANSLDARQTAALATYFSSLPTSTLPKSTSATVGPAR